MANRCIRVRIPQQPVPPAPAAHPAPRLSRRPAPMTPCAKNSRTRSCTERHLIKAVVDVLAGLTGKHAVNERQQAVTGRMADDPVLIQRVVHLRGLRQRRALAIVHAVRGSGPTGADSSLAVPGSTPPIPRALGRLALIMDTRSCPHPRGRLVCRMSLNGIP